MNLWVIIKRTAIGIAAAILIGWLPCPSYAQTESSASEVYLTFNHEGIVNSYVTAYYKNEQFFLPVTELFEILKVPYKLDQGNFTVSGTYPDDTPFTLNFKQQSVSSGEKEVGITADDYLIKELDYFVKPEIFEELFGFSFSTNFSNLTLSLTSRSKPPVVVQYERAQERNRITRAQGMYDQSNYPLEYDRDYAVLDGGFLDYNVSATYNNDASLLVLNNRIGAELLGGDIQGSTFGVVSDQQSTFTTNGLRWRYVQRNSNYFSTATVGQTQTEGITNRSITGFKISNEPVEPRILFDRYVIDGDGVPPQSEVELYLNNRLVDYQQADESGSYRFVVPLTYGSTNYSVQIFTPSGQAIERKARIQIPFDYLPSGQVDYSISGGRLENPIIGSTERGYAAEATISAGLASWLTARASSEYLTAYHDHLPSFTGTLNARLLSKYLVSVSANSENFYNFTSSVVYSSGASWNLSYDYNPGESQIYNIGGFEHQGNATLFTPFTLGNVPVNIRLSGTYRQTGTSDFLRYRTDLNTRLGRLNIRLGFQDQQAGPFELQTTSASRITNSYTYSLPRNQRMPAVFQGMFIRGRLSYLPGFKRMEEIEMQLSRDLFQTGRAQLTYGRNFIGEFNEAGLNITIDFNKIRSNTTSRYNNSSYSVTQNFRGSVGYYADEKRVLLDNRQQVGQSGAAVRLFVDRNDDGTYQDSTDQLISDPAVRLNRSGGRVNVENGINYISRLLPYYRYDIEINKGALSNPLLVPDVEDFSIITDPNQYKTIDIPFYQSGVIDGMVQRKSSDSTQTGVAGLRLYLKQQNGDFTKEIRTFSDGSFYAYEIPPGEYVLSADSTQLQILGTVSAEKSKEFTVEARSQGDFISGLNFTLTPASMAAEQKTEDTAPEESEEPEPETEQNRNGLLDLFESEDTKYELQLGRYGNVKEAQQAAQQAQLLFNRPYRLKFNRHFSRYTLRSYPFEKRTTAMKELDDFQNSPFQEAVLVITVGDEQVQRPDIKQITQMQYSVQLGAFESRGNARSLADSVKKQLSSPLVVLFDEEMGYYKVRLKDTFPKWNQAYDRLENVRSVTSQQDAFIARETKTISNKPETEEIELAYRYKIFVEGVTPINKQSYTSALSTSSEVSIAKNERNDILVFNNITGLQEAQNLQQRLNQISATGRPVIVLVEYK